MKRNQLLMLISALQLMLLAPLAWWVHNHPVDNLDLKITRTVQKKQTPFLNAISLCLSLLCSWQFVNLASVPVGLALWRARLRLEALMFAGVAILVTAGRKLLQAIVARPRPSPTLVHVEKKKHSESFPSGHAATAIAGWGWLFALLNVLLKGKHPWKQAALAFIALVIALAGPSRVYLGEHWTSDVAGGYLYGGAWFTLSYQLYLVLKDKGALAGKHETRHSLKSLV